MKNFKRDGGSGGFKKFGGNKFGGNKGFGDRGGAFMHDATCSKCGKNCQVPFKPNGRKPIFCNECFAAEKEGGSFQNRSGGNNYTKASFGDKPMFQTICAKCGVSCEVPFRPVNGKPAYCKNCFDKGGNNNFPPLSKGRLGGVAGSDQFQNQFDALNAKLDKILKLLNPTTAIGMKKEKSEEMEVEEKEVKPVVDKKKAKSETKTKAVAKKAVKKKK